ncbi:hypothetical protein BDY19DRAFT_991560 [Irpex rosettiformis]|uniref:Uncharacterized protein n=1 Tax=Irpex rosettiformis TaxID=378272 RepID=A0ACB8U9F2_9APHY|nr:hypothetical protein BDY19DRAFT_991560 [Irpex rosettiformis]
MLLATVFLALPLLTAATAIVGRGSCDTGPVHCCETAHKVDSEAGKALLREHNLENHPSAHFGSVAQNCDTGLGILDGSTCSGAPVCCESFLGLISIGCIVVHL